MQQEPPSPSSSVPPQTSDPSLRTMDHKIRRASWLLMASVLLSRLIGFLREMILARTVGASSMTDVYYASFTLPDFLNYLMAAGALSISFIPMLSEYIAKNDEATGKLVFRSLTTVLGTVLFVLIVIAEFFARDLSRWIAPGFNPQQLETLTQLTRIILPAQWFIFWGGLATAIQHTHGRFFLPAMSPIVYNAGIIICGIGLHERYGVAGFSVGVLVGAVFSHGLLPWWGIRSLGYGVAPYFHFSQEIRAALHRYLWLTLPIMLGFSVVVTDEWISKYFASQLEEKAISWLSYARTEMRIPLAVIGQAAGIASFPYLSRLWSKADYPSYARTLLREIAKLWAAAPIAGVLLMVHALPITHAIYGGSRFTFSDLEATAEALQFFGVGMVFWTLQTVLARGFYAAQRTWLPSLVGTVLSLVMIPLYQYLAKRHGHVGLAASGSIAIAIYSVVLWGLLVVHMKKVAPEISFANFYCFAFRWSFVVVAMYAIASGLFALGIYQKTQISAIADVVVTTAVLGGVSLVLLRTTFQRWTDGPLF